MPPARQQAYQAYDAPAVPSRQRSAERAHRAGLPVGLPHLPIAHVLLVAGIAAMAFAISQPWGTDASGTPVYVHDFANARLARHGIDAGSIAVNAAVAIVIISAILGAGLILLNSVVTLLNRILGIVGLSGCASLVFFPVLWGGATLLFLALLAAAGFAGLGAFSNLPVVQGHGFSLVAVKQNGLGFYLWAGGIVAAFIGMLGQLVLRRR
jgi:hypothetical protein